MFLIMAVPFLLLELYFSLKVGENIGFMFSALWIVMSMIVGIRVLKFSSLSIMGNMSAVSRGKLSMQSFQNASTAYLIGAIFLIIPGVLTDFLGVLALIYTLYLQFVAKITPEKTKFTQEKGEENVIDVEIINEYPDSNSRT